MSALLGKLRSFDAYSKPMEDFRIKTLTGGAVTLISGCVMVLLFVTELRIFLTSDVVEELFVDSSPGDERVSLHFDITFPALTCNFLTVDAMDVSGEHQSDVSHSVWKTRLDTDGNKLTDVPDKQEVNVATSAPNTTTMDPKLALEKKHKEVDKCGSCYGAETDELRCCNTCEHVKQAYRHKGWALQDMSRIEQCQGDQWVTGMKDGKKEGCRVHGEIKVVFTPRAST